jgi:hypothetical protein
MYDFKLSRIPIEVGFFSKTQDVIDNQGNEKLILLSTFEYYKAV